MPAEAPGKRFPVTATKATVHGRPAVELNHAGIAYKSAQPAPAVPSVANATAATQIAIGEEFVMSMDGAHEFASTLLPGGAKAGDRLWINPADNSLQASARAGQVNPSVKIPVSATGGTFTITIEGQVTAAISATATAAELLAALEALPNIDKGDVTVTGGPGDATGTKPYVITFVKGKYSNGPVPAITTQTASLTGTKTAPVENVIVGVEGSENVKFGLIDFIDTVALRAHVNLTQRSSF